MKSKELRQKFIEFFEEKGHKVIPSASLVSREQDLTESDKTLFTTAGMQQFKSFYINPDSTPYSCAVSSQKCIRTSDIKEVGDETHLTFFEMLGNFSFGYPEKRGSYFKKEAIEYAWEFLTKELNINKERISATYFCGEDNLLEDSESLKILQKIEGLKKIKPQGFKENFWSLGTEGSPGGPTVEFYIDDIEIWNLVLNEYIFKNGKYKPSKYKGVDTGMGLERLVAVMQDKNNVYETELFEPIIERIEKFSDKKYTDHEKEFRIIADHIKAAVFALSEEVVPSNKLAGYQVRRLIRRAIVKAIKINIKHNFCYLLAEKVYEIYINVYKFKETFIKERLEEEEFRFRELLLCAIPRKNKRIEIINRINQSYKENSIVEWQKDKKWIESDNEYIGTKFFREISRLNEEFRKNSIKSSIIEAGVSVISGLSAFRLESTYGYSHELFFDELSSKLPDSIIRKAQKIFLIAEEEHRNLSRTASAGMFKGGLAESGEKEIKYHSATHLLHQALRQVLGNHVQQKGSNITTERLRFDFTHPDKLTVEQINEVENIVNEAINNNLEVIKEEVSLKEAKDSGALGFFEHKYGDKVKVYTIGDLSTGSGHPFSREICGGPHVKNTSELGHFSIKKEESSSTGVRRIKAVLD